MIHTQRFLLDPLTAPDAQAVFAYRSLPEVSVYQTFEPGSLADVEAFVARQPPAFGVPDTWFQLAVRHRRSLELIGDAGVHFVGDAQAEIGITISPTHQRQGVATEVVAGLLAHLLGKLKKHRVSASVDPRNVASMALMQRAGLRKEAHHRDSLWFKGEWVDDVVFAKLRSDWQIEKWNGRCPFCVERFGDPNPRRCKPCGAKRVRDEAPCCPEAAVWSKVGILLCAHCRNRVP